MKVPESQKEQLVFLNALYMAVQVWSATQIMTRLAPCDDKDVVKAASDFLIQEFKQNKSE